MANVPTQNELQNDIAVPANALVGDENLPAHEPEVQQINESVPAQIMQDKVQVVDTVKVTETHVALDQVITDPSSPLAVQVPDAGRGFLDLPIHRLAVGNPEAQFAAAAAAAKKAKK